MTEEIKKYLTNPLISVTTKFKWILDNKNEELLKWCVENYIQIEMGNQELRNLLHEIKDISYLKDYIKNPSIFIDSEIKKSIILQLHLVDPEFKDKTKFKEYIEECIEDNSIGFALNDICDLIEEVNDDEFTKKCIYNENLYLDIRSIKYLLGNLNVHYDNNKEFIQTILLDERMPFAKKDRVELIIGTGDKEFIEKCIDDKSSIFGDKYSAERTYLAITLCNKDILKKCINMPKDIGKLNINENLTYGIELEAENDIEDEDADYYRIELINRDDDPFFDESFYEPYRTILNWQVKKESSLFYGIEFASPILENCEDDIESIYRITTLMKQLRLHTTNDCGGHIHIGAHYFDCVDDYKNLFEIWGNSEKILYLIANKEGEYPREEVIKYAKPIPRENENKKSNEDDKYEFIEDAKKRQDNIKKFGLNIKNVGDLYNNTIEFRMSNGTLEPEIILQNITLYARIMQASKEITKIMNKIRNGEKITKEEKQKLIYKEMLKRNIPDDDNMKILMNLLFDKDNERTIYEKRYYANKDFLVNNNLMRNAVFPKIDYGQLQEKDEIMKEVDKYSENFETQEVR